MATKWNNRTVPAADKKAILIALQVIIKKHGIQKVKPVVNNYFKTYVEKKKAQQKIEELKKEIAALEKKK